MVGHERVVDRFQRYRDANGYNLAINARQFGGVSRRRMPGLVAAPDRPFLPDDACGRR